MKIRKQLTSLITKRTEAPKLSIDPVEYADPLFGVGSATSAGPTLPGGSIHPSPETLIKDCGGYTREQPIVGFGQAYLSGTGGTKSFGNYLLAPMVDGIDLESKSRASFAVEGSEIARCFEYTVALENGIKAKVTPAHNAAIYSFEYPAGKEASFLLDAARKLDIEACMKEGSITIDPTSKRISGGGLYSGNWNAIDWEMFFVLEFDADFTEIGSFKGSDIIPRSAGEICTVSICEKERLGAYVKFGITDKVRTVNVKISISFVSVEKAKAFLDEQIPAFDYDAVKEAAKSAWRDTLGVIELKTTDKALLRRFYTAMYHMNIQPRDRTDDHGTWDDIHTTWDSWKTVFPMYSLLYPEKTASIVESFIKRAKTNEAAENGIVIADEYSAAKEFLAGQGGNDIDNVIVDAYMKGIKLVNYDWEDAYSVLLDSAEKMRSKEYVEGGFATNNRMTVTGKAYSGRFKSAAATLGFAFNDKAIAAMAKDLGKCEDYDKYEKRSLNWRNVWNDKLESEGFLGFPQSPDEDGSFAEGFDAHGGYNSHFYEATAWDAAYINYNDVPHLVETMGGPEIFTERLVWACEHSVNYYNDDHGKEGYLNFTNEPSFHIPWLFCTDEIRRPDLAAKVIDTIIARFSCLDDYPGDEDNGGMSSYYVFLMCGFFPYSTTDDYYLHGTRVEEIVFHLGNGRDFIVTGENVGNGNIYVQSATWKREKLDVCRLTHEQILGGGELHFVMGDTPSDWARK
ncbi:MAG: GH92 family glycosyl hydrolase [Oscillospiraceae bacterium]|nr:GH92 family glycosyl hydrolase [Oscillospiraceae bacterium]